jgi:NDP-sugar pyrophosphorylase family protein
MQIVILSGGLATRLGPIASATPKAMVDVHGRPFLALQLELLKRNGIDDVVLCVGHFADKIKDYFKDGKAFGVRIRYSDEGRNLMGTAGALKKAEPLLADSFLVLDGDAYLPLDYQEISREFGARGKPALMVVYKNRDLYDKSNVVCERGEVTIYDRSRRHPGMVYIHAGLSALSRKVLELIPADRPSAQDELWAQLIARRELQAFETGVRFHEVGSASGLEELRQFAAARS